MEEILFRLNTFEGPLDLLLYLITKHKLNIYDIEISLLLEQYMEYMNNIPETDLDSAGEFLEMAARLIYIKTVSLLPTYDEGTQLKKELQGKLIEYSLCKRAAEILKDSYIGTDIFVRQPMKFEIDKRYNVIHNPEDLLLAYGDVATRAKDHLPPPVSIFRPLVSKKIVSVTSKIIFILRKLYISGKYQMNNLYAGITDKSEKIATFLAVLELTKSGRISLNDDNTELTFNRNKKVLSDGEETVNAD